MSNWPTIRSASAGPWRPHIFASAYVLPSVRSSSSSLVTSLIEALAAGRIDAVVRTGIGNLAAAKGSGGAFAVTALDARAETGGIALAAEDAALAACLDRYIARPTGSGRFGVREWFEDPSVLVRRGRQAAAER